MHLSAAFTVSVLGIVATATAKASSVQFCDVESSSKCFEVSPEVANRLVSNYQFRNLKLKREDKTVTVTTIPAYCISPGMSAGSAAATTSPITPTPVPFNPNAAKTASAAATPESSPTTYTANLAESTVFPESFPTSKPTTSVEAGSTAFPESLYTPKPIASAALESAVFPESAYSPKPTASSAEAIIFPESTENIQPTSKVESAAEITSTGIVPGYDGSSTPAAGPSASSKVGATSAVSSAVTKGSGSAMPTGSGVGGGTQTAGGATTSRTIVPANGALSNGPADTAMAFLGSVVVLAMVI